MRWSPICGDAFGSSTPTFSRKRREQGCLTRFSRHTRFLRLIFARDATIWSRRSACSSSVRDQRRKRLEGSFTPETSATSASAREYQLTDVDLFGPETCFAVAQIIFPQPPERLVEPERGQVRPGMAEARSPDRDRLGVVL